MDMLRLASLYESESFKKQSLSSILPLRAAKRQAPESAEQGKIEAEIIPPPCVVPFIDAIFAVDRAEDKREQSNPAVPNAPEESRRGAVESIVSDDLLRRIWLLDPGCRQSQKAFLSLLLLLAYGMIGSHFPEIPSFLGGN